MQALFWGWGVGSRGRVRNSRKKQTIIPVLGASFLPGESLPCSVVPRCPGQAPFPAAPQVFHLQSRSVLREVWQPRAPTQPGIEGLWHLRRDPRPDCHLTLFPQASCTERGLIWPKPLHPWTSPWVLTPGFTRYLNRTSVGHLNLPTFLQAVPRSPWDSRN